jgi:hypothetical protein
MTRQMEVTPPTMLRARIPAAQAAAEANARASIDRGKLRRAEEMLAAGNAADAESILLELNRGEKPAFRPEEFQRLDDANRRLYALRRGG